MIRLPYTLYIVQYKSDVQVYMHVCSTNRDIHVHLNVQYNIIPCFDEVRGRCLAAIFATVSLGGGRSFTNECSSRILQAIFLFSLETENWVRAE